MKELLLQAVLDAGTCDITPPALCRWLIALTGGPTEGATGHTRKFYHTPCPDVLEIWFQDTLSQQAENVICYSRISFRPLLPASAATSSTVTDCRIAVEVLPPEQIYIDAPLSEMGLVGASPRLVAIDGWVVQHGSLSRGLMGSLNRAYAVLTPALAVRLGVSFHTERQMMASTGPYDVLRQEVERLLALCFPGGGEVEGCRLLAEYECRPSLVTVRLIGRGECSPQYFSSLWCPPAGTIPLSQHHDALSTGRTGDCPSAFPAFCSDCLPDGSGTCGRCGQMGAL